jgi:ankyrin repeat protein
VEDSYNVSALQLAAFKGRADLVAMIVTAGVDVNQGDSKVSCSTAFSTQSHSSMNAMQCKETALHWAAFHGHAAVIGVLCAASANLNVQNKVSRFVGRTRSGRSFSHVFR